MVKHRFFYLLNRAQRAVKTRVERQTQAALGLTSLELTALWALSASPNQGVQSLARALGVDHAVISRLSKQLVRKGVAVRASDPKDRRRTRLELTDLGIEKVADGRRMLAVANARIADGFTDHELDIAAGFLEQLIAFGTESSPLLPTDSVLITPGDDHDESHEET